MTLYFKTIRTQKHLDFNVYESYRTCKNTIKMKTLGVMSVIKIS
ncbi:hypothetical protein DYY66_2531 [Candidatus Nitrosotalea sp. FS]|nr:hypothetical protein [Candidatus Nitrosotalea sp. FS]